MLGEVELGRGLEAIGAVAKVDLVRIHLEDLVLGEDALDLHGEQDFLELSAVGLLVGEEEIARELHGERGGALRAAARVQVAPGGADGADEVDAPVAFEGLVLNGDQRLAQDGRKVGIGNDDAALEGEGTESRAVDIEQFSGGVRAVAEEVVHLRKVDRVDEHKPAARRRARRAAAG